MSVPPGGRGWEIANLEKLCDAVDDVFICHLDADRNRVWLRRDSLPEGSFSLKKAGEPKKVASRDHRSGMHRGDRRESNPCARIHTPVLCQLSYGHQRDAQAPSAAEQERMGARPWGPAPARSRTPQCRERDSNSHARRRSLLRRVRLPVPPSRRGNSNGATGNRTRAFCRDRAASSPIDDGTRSSTHSAAGWSRTIVHPINSRLLGR